MEKISLNFPTFKERSKTIFSGFCGKNGQEVLQW